MQTARSVQKPDQKGHELQDPPHRSDPGGGRAVARGWGQEWGRTEHGARGFFSGDEEFWKYIVMVA